MSPYEEEFNYVNQGLIVGNPPQQVNNECAIEVGCSVAEAKYFHVGGTLQDTRLSVQHLVDCNDCDANEEFGGDIDNVWFYMEHFGVAITADYPRRTDGTRSDCLECQGSVIPKFKIDGFKNIDKNVEDIIEALHVEGPLAVLFWCGTVAWHGFTGGITEDGGVFREDPGDQYDNVGKHYVILVGYDIKQTYWILRTTGGPDWGDNGLMRLMMEKTDCFLEVLTPVNPHRLVRVEGKASSSRNKEKKNKKRKSRGGGWKVNDNGKKKNKKGGMHVVF